MIGSSSRDTGTCIYLVGFMATFSPTDSGSYHLRFVSISRFIYDLFLGVRLWEFSPRTELDCVA